MSRILMRRGSETAIATILALTTGSAAFSAALERAVPSTTRILFEEGRYIEFGVNYADPDQSGEGADLTAVGTPIQLEGDTGDLFDSHVGISGAYKANINDRMSYAIILDQPLGADTSYGAGTFDPLFGFTYDGSTADLDTYQFTGILAYDINNSFKVFGGLRAQRLDASATIPFVSDYAVDADADWGYGYLVGGAYHMPEIALRVGLTYYSKIEHSLDLDESSAAFGAQDTETDIDTPQSVTLDFQSGVAENTLVFGSVRWVDWSEFAINPDQYVALTGGRALVDYEEDWWTYSLGLAHRLTDKLAGSFSVTYEPSVDETLTTLGPYDGRTTATAALSYDIDDNLNITGGLTYGKLGDAENLLETDFNDGSVWGAGVRVGWNF